MSKRTNLILAMIIIVIVLKIFSYYNDKKIAEMSGLLGRYTEHDPILILKEKFPEDFALFVNEIKSLQTGNFSKNFSEEKIFTFFISFKQKYADYIYSASGEQIDKVLFGVLYLYEAVYQTEGWRTCNRVLLKGIRTGLGENYQNYRFFAERQTAAALNAIAHSVENPVRRTSVLDSDWQRLQEKMQDLGYSIEDLVFFSEKYLHERDLCPTFIALLKSAIDLEDESGDRIKANFALQLFKGETLGI